MCGFISQAIIPPSRDGLLVYIGRNRNERFLARPGLYRLPVFGMYLINDTIYKFKLIQTDLVFQLDLHNDSYHYIIYRIN